MSLPHKEWRAYLDNILDAYMRANITIDSGEYMVDRMEQVCIRHYPDSCVSLEHIFINWISFGLLDLLGTPAPGTRTLHSFDLSSFSRPSGRLP